MPIYLVLVINRVFLSGGVRAEHSKPYSQRGALLYCVGYRRLTHPEGGRCLAEAVRV
jgi:hypothetical protein